MTDVAPAPAPTPAPKKATKPKTERPATVRVWPSPKLGPTEYVPGIPADGIDLSPEDAAPLLESGVVVRSRPARPANPKE